MRAGGLRTIAFRSDRSKYLQFLDLFAFIAVDCRGGEPSCDCFQGGFVVAVAEFADGRQAGGWNALC
jgi:hypothetical protein